MAATQDDNAPDIDFDALEVEDVEEERQPRKRSRARRVFPARGLRR